MELFCLVIGFALGFFVGNVKDLQDIAIDLWDETKVFASKVRRKIKERRG